MNLFIEIDILIDVMVSVYAPKDEVSHQPIKNTFLQYLIGGHFSMTFIFNLGTLDRGSKCLRPFWKCDGQTNWVD